MRRIPVAAGVNFGLASEDAIPYCTTESENDVFLRFGADVPVGGKANPAGTEDFSRLALVVVVEPDADGYGDETQDLCPQSGATQSACPAPPGIGGGATVKLKGKPRKRHLTMVIEAKAAGAATASAELTLPGRKRPPPDRARH